MAAPRSLVNIFAAVRRKGHTNDVSLSAEIGRRPESSSIVPHPITESGSFLELPELLPRDGAATEL